MGSRKYSTPLDIWSVGCVFAEMVNGTPLFTGTSEESQLETIFRHLGTPDETTFPGMSELSGGAAKIADLQHYPTPSSLQHLVPKLDPIGVDLLQLMLMYDPARRITAQDARRHAFFNSLPDNIKRIGNEMA
jgi:cyclin-dependent kinase